MPTNNVQSPGAPSGFEGIDREPTGRVLPQAQDVEMAVLGAMMRDAEAVTLVRAILEDTDFYKPAHRKVYAAACAVDDARGPVDVMTVAAELERNGNLDKCGGRAGLFDIADTVFTAANAPAHARLIAEKATLRRLIEGCTDITERCYNRPGNLSELLDSANSMIGTISARENESCRSASDIALDAIRQMEEYRANRGKPKMSWGFSTLDKLTGGLRVGDYNIIAGQTSMGKTSFVLNVSLKLAKVGIPVGIFTIEMSDTEIMEALFCIDANVDGMKMVKGELSNEDYERVGESAAAIASLPIHVDRAKDINIHQLKAKTQRLKRTKGVQVVVVDYLQLMKGPKVQNREQEIAALSRGCKVLAQEAGVCMLVLSQLSRAAKMRENKEPELSDLRDSGSIEQDADTVLFCHRPQRYDSEANAEDALLLLKKQRKGPTGRILCKFHEHQRIFSSDRILEKPRREAAR